MTKSFSDQPGLGKLMKQAQEMQKKMQDVQKQVSEMLIIGKSGGQGKSGKWLVEIEMNGQHMVKRVTLDPSLMKEEMSIVEDLIAAAINDAATKIEKGTREKMSSLTGIKLPDGFDLPTGV
jgi:DNA-binding YbaB/EbfC family protein